MFEHVGLIRARNVTLSFVLLTYATVSSAEADVIQGGVETSEAPATTEAVTPHRDAGYVFPRWPESTAPKRERVPSPPPGPYMSTALTGFSIDGPSFRAADDSRSHRRSMPGAEEAAADIQSFSSDTPWPDSPASNNNTPVKRWMPEKGYQYVDQSEHSGSAYYVPPHYMYGYQRPGRSFSGPSIPGSNMNTPSMNWSGNRWVPSMNSGRSYNAPYGMAPGRYYSRPPYAERAGGAAEEASR